jgi:hypothetical protein
MAELLLYSLQPKEDGEARLVHPSATYEMVRKEASTLSLDEFVTRSEIIVQTTRAKNAIVICMHMKDEHRKAV